MGDFCGTRLTPAAGRARIGSVRSGLFPSAAPGPRGHPTLPPAPAPPPVPPPTLTVTRPTSGRHTPMPFTRPRGLLYAVVSLLAFAALPVSAQPTPDEQAQQLLTAGRQAYHDGNPQFA